MQFKNKKLYVDKEVRIYTSFSDASDGGCRVRFLVPPLCYNMCCFKIVTSLHPMPQSRNNQSDFLENFVWIICAVHTTFRGILFD